MKRLQHLASIALILVLPVVLLWPCLFGDRTYVPWDIAQFPPAATVMTDAELAATRENNRADVTEVPAMFVPELRFLKSELTRGTFPHWNPYARAGTPAWSPSILGPWYPPNWLLLARDDPQDGLALGAFLAVAIAALLMYGFLIHLGLSIPGALFGTLVFALSGTHLAQLHFYQRINALIWLPGMLWAIHAIGQRRGAQRIPAILGLAACMFATHTAGFPPYALAVTLVTVAFSAVVLWLGWRRLGIGAVPGLAVCIAGGAAIGVLMAAVQSVPMFEFFPESNRTMDPSGNNLAANAFDPAGLLGYLCPTLFTHPHINSVGGLRDQYSPLFWTLFSRSSWEAEAGLPAGTILAPNLNFCEYTVFVGTSTLFLAIAGALRRAAPLRRVAVTGLIASLVCASAPPWLAPVLELPPLSWVPPQRFVGAACLFVALLAAGGMHGLGSLRDGVRNLLWVLAFAAALGMACLGFWAYSLTPMELLTDLAPTLEAKHAARYPSVPAAEFRTYLAQFLGPDIAMARTQMVRNFFTSALALVLTGMLFFMLPRIQRSRFGRGAIVALLLGITGWELLSFGIPLNTGRVLAARPLNDTPVHAFLRTQRDAAASTGGFAVVRAHDDRGGSRPVTEPSQLPPDTLLNEHIRDWQAYTFVDGRSHKPFRALYGEQQLIRDIWPLSIRDSEALQRPLWDMLGVRFVLSVDPLSFAGTRVGPTWAGPKDAAEKTRHFYIFERSSALPRAWVVHDYAAIEPDPDRADPDAPLVDAIIDPAFRPADRVVLDAATAARIAATVPRRALTGRSRTVTFPTPGETSELTIDVGAGEPGYLVVNDTFMRGWTVTLNGAPAVIHRGNLFQRVVVLPAGKARVHFSYTTPGFGLGLGLSAVGILLALGLLAWFALKRRRAPGAGSSPADADAEASI